ncbi:hypothetical protein XENTR_v10005803 [Xenopus tropicalis]|nr:hypothetical protein XENTR_v10005803 [Xenopus tropicalis]
MCLHPKGAMWVRVVWAQLRAKLHHCFPSLDINLKLSTPCATEATLSPGSSIIHLSIGVRTGEASSVWCAACPTPTQ